MQRKEVPEDVDHRRHNWVPSVHPSTSNMLANSTGLKNKIPARYLQIKRLPGIPPVK